MRILHCIHSMNPEGGGPVEFVKLLTAAHERMGHRSVIASLDPRDTELKPIASAETVNLGVGARKYGFSRIYRRWLEQNASGFDHVLIHGLWQYQTLGAWQALAKTKKPYFIFPHGMLDPWFNRAYPIKRFKKWLYWNAFERKTMRDARAVIFTATKEAALARQSFPRYVSREKIAGLGCARPTGKPGSFKRAFFERYPTLQNKTFILFLGRLHEKKGVDLLLRAFADASSDIRLAVIGPCADLQYLDQLKSLVDRIGPERILFDPHMVTGAVKWGAFHAASAFILPSHQENFGIAVVEALACGAPALISHQVNIWEEIIGAGAGLVAEDSVAGATRLLNDWTQLSAEQQAQMRQMAVKCFDEHFEIEGRAANLLRVLEET